MPQKTTDINDRQQAALDNAGVSFDALAQAAVAKQVREALNGAFRSLSQDDQIAALTAVNANPLT